MRYCNAPSEGNLEILCGNPIERTRYASGKLEPLHKFEERQCCSSKCTLRKVREKRKVVKVWSNICEVCGQLIEPITYKSGKPEPWHNYIKKRSHAWCRGKLSKMTKEKKYANSVIELFKEDVDTSWTWLISSKAPSYRPANQPRLLT